jgi:glyoxylase-like metal-dependent hydrolase (beta-lactamase superfamily II)
MEIVRVDDPGWNLDLPQDDAARAALALSPWLQPHYVTPELALRVGSSAIVVRSGGTTVVIDPFLTFDDPGKTAARLAALPVAPADVDVVVNSHIDGMGVNVLADGSPAFPNARYVLPRAELADVRSGKLPGAEAWLGLDPLLVDGGEEVAPDIHVEAAPGHNAGHVVTWLGDDVVVVGHLFLHPAQIANPEVVQGDADPVALVATRRALLERCAATGTRLLGHLFAAPGGGAVVRDGDGYALSS